MFWLFLRAFSEEAAAAVAVVIVVVAAAVCGEGETRPVLLRVFWLGLCVPALVLQAILLTQHRFRQRPKESSAH